MRLLLDTNVILAAFIAHGTCHELLEDMRKNHIWIGSDFILHEVERNFDKKLRFSKVDVKRVMDLIVSAMIRVNPQIIPQGICRDASDHSILAAAEEGQCDGLITGDQDLLILNKYNKISIVRPADYWKFTSVM